MMASSYFTEYYTPLEGVLVVLEPLSESHLDGLWTAGKSEQVWEWSPWPITSYHEMRDYIRRALNEHLQGDCMPYVTTDMSTQEIIGATRFMNIVPEHRRLEIGHTWVNPHWQRTGRNRDAKYLMLRHAFETMGIERVELKTDALNVQSRTAIERLGATEEGIFRHHVITRSGRVRDTAWYSILAPEWPAIKQRLETQLSGR